MATPTAKLFQDGGSQAVRLPADLWFPGTEVNVRGDERTGDVLSARPAGQWSEFVALRERLGGVPEDFLADRDQPLQVRVPLSGA